MFRPEVGRVKRFLGPILIIEKDLEVVDLYSEGRFIRSVHDFCSQLRATMSSACAPTVWASNSLEIIGRLPVVWGFHVRLLQLTVTSRAPGFGLIRSGGPDLRPEAHRSEWMESMYTYASGCAE